MTMARNYKKKYEEYQGTAEQRHNRKKGNR
jgi:hypothetical protein